MTKYKFNALGNLELELGSGEISKQEYKKRVFANDEYKSFSTKEKAIFESKLDSAIKHYLATVVRL